MHGLYDFSLLTLRLRMRATQVSTRMWGEVGSRRTSYPAMGLGPGLHTPRIIAGSTLYVRRKLHEGESLFVTALGSRWLVPG